MPRVSQDHLDARRRQIVEAAWRCFARDGFHQTSMQDILTESGLSAGAVYRYFTGKNELIRAIAAESTELITTAIEKALAVEPMPPLADILTQVVETVATMATGAPADPTRIAVQVWAEALRDPELAGFVRGVYRDLRGMFVGIARRAAAAGRLPAGADTDRVGQVLFGLLPGFVLQRLLIGDVDVEDYRAGLAGLLGTG